LGLSRNSKNATQWQYILTQWQRLGIKPQQQKRHEVAIYPNPMATPWD